MTEKRFSIKEGSSIGLSSIYTDNGKVMTQLEVLDVLIKQHETIQTLAKENEQLKAQLYCDSDEGVCIICKHHYLEKKNIFYISKCEKGHEKCSKEDLKHCKDFEVKEL